MKDVVIIGGGLGGLFTGAILAKEGLKVFVLEKNSTAGGGLQTFRRFGLDFDTGMHVIGGLQKNGNIQRLCDYLGITDGIKIRDVDDDCADELMFTEDNSIYKIAKGKEGYISSLTSYFPKSEAELRNYIEAVYRIANAIDLFNLRPSTTILTSLPEDSLLPADDFIAKYISDTKLRSVVAYMNPLYGGEGGKTPALIHAIISTLYINGASRFIDGSSQMTDLLTAYIKNRGGYVILNDAVEEINVESGMVQDVVTKRGKIYKGDYYISDVHPCVLLNLIHGKAFTNAYVNRLKSIPNSYSAFSLYIKMKTDTFPYINHSVYITKHYGDIWNFGNPDAAWPLGLLMMTPPVCNQGRFSDKVLITVPMRYEMARLWENTVTGNRGKDYEAWKDARTREALQLVEARFPGFTDKVEKVNTSSPLTIRDFYGTKDGAISGYSKDCNNMMLSNIQVATKVRNLFLTGQNVNLHGFCGVPLTAIMTSEAILGRNYIINKINGECD